MRSYLLLFLLVVVKTAFSQQQLANNQFSLKGTTNLKDGERIFLKYAGVNDSAIVKSGKFFFKGIVEEPTYATINNGKTNVLDGPRSIRVFIEPISMEINALEGKFYSAKLSGSETQSALDELSFKDEYDVIRDSLEYWANKIKTEESTLLSESNISTLYKKRSKLQDLINERKLAYLKNNPQSYLSPFLLVTLNGLSQDSIRLYYNRFSPLVQNSSWGRMVYKQLNYKILSGIGQQAPIFKANSLTNEEIVLSNFIGEKYVLLDFWGTWCIKCRELSPDLISFYKKYQTKGLEILSVAYDGDRKLWKNAISADKTGLWKHVLLKDVKSVGSNEGLLIQYSVGAFPTFILIDKEGKIAGRYVGSGNEFYINLKTKLKEIFE